MVSPSKTNTNEMLMVDVIFAFTNRAVNIFLFFKTIFSRLGAK